ncbi:hypothetical protein Gogos_021966 [Gossypium gossypioides]|uniref:Uncharacterized protein n=1 Tax=Gossypium gossypioides TaxID=34282 RepID=A0A7J9D463_GOSGO|nr:hypothetical protein [Gossypium gossypioides]
MELLESRDEKVGLRARVAELERSLHQHRSRNSVIELKVSLTKIEELKRKQSSRLHCKIVNFELSFLKRTMNIGKINSNALRVRSGIETTS